MIVEVHATLRTRLYEADFGLGIISFMLRSSVDLPDAHVSRLTRVSTIDDWNGRWLSVLRVR
jgi:hypothetical protein